MYDIYSLDVAIQHSHMYLWCSSTFKKNAASLFPRWPLLAPRLDHTRLLCDVDVSAQQLVGFRHSPSSQDSS
jgi:hypothetical protein